MAKQSQIDKALANLRAEREVLDLAIRKLEAQQSPEVKRVRKAKPHPADVMNAKP